MFLTSSKATFVFRVSFQAINSACYVTGLLPRPSDCQRDRLLMQLCAKQATLCVRSLSAAEISRLFTLIDHGCPLCTYTESMHHWDLRDKCALITNAQTPKSFKMNVSLSCIFIRYINTHVVAIVCGHKYVK